MLQSTLVDTNMVCVIAATFAFIVRLSLLPFPPYVFYQWANLKFRLADLDKDI